MTGRAKAGRIVRAIAIAIIVTSSFSVAIATVGGVRGGSRLPDPAHDRTVPYNEHGTIIFIRPWQAHLADWSTVGCLFGFAILAASFWLSPPKNDVL